MGGEGGSRFLHYGPHFRLASIGKKLRESGMDPEEVRKKLIKAQAEQDEFMKGYEHSEIPRVKASGKKKEEGIEEVKGHSRPGTIAERKASEKEEERKKNLEKSKELMRNLRPDKVDNKFYGHYEPHHFKRTSIVSTTGRVR
jgi:hypothetical protein